MSTIYINDEPHELLARARPAGPPYKEQDGSYVGIDHAAAFSGGACNLRLTIEQAHALRDVLYRYTQKPGDYTIAKAKDGKLRMEANRHVTDHIDTADPAPSSLSAQFFRDLQDLRKKYPMCHLESWTPGDFRVDPDADEDSQPPWDHPIHVTIAGKLAKRQDASIGTNWDTVNEAIIDALEAHPELKSVK